MSFPMHFHSFVSVYFKTGAFSLRLTHAMTSYHKAAPDSTLSVHAETDSTLPLDK